MGASVEVIVQYPAVDWITLTTFDLECYKNWAESLSMEMYGPGKHGAKRMQYEGAAGLQWFLGVAKQNGKLHYMVQVSGSMAHTFLIHTGHLIETFDINCTRIDVQITVEKPDDSEGLARLGAVIRSTIEQVEANPKKRPIVSVFDTGGVKRETVYIGSRTSRIFTRIYEKSIDDVDYVRYEVEYKRELAQSVYMMLLRDLKEAGRVLKTQIAKIPVISPTLAALGRACDVEGYSYPTYVRDKPDNERTMQWLEETVTPIMSRLHIEGYAERIEAMIKSVLDKAIGR